MNRAKEIQDIIHGYTGDVYDEKSDALAVAHAVAKSAGDYCFAIEGKFGWFASKRKPMLRSGRVIECTVAGQELLA